jgi:hypothetical protein
MDVRVCHRGQRELEKRLSEPPRRREIVAYCRGPSCAFAPGGGSDAQAARLPSSRQQFRRPVTPIRGWLQKQTRQNGRREPALESKRAEWKDAGDSRDKQDESDHIEHHAHRA